MGAAAAVSAKGLCGGPSPPSSAVVTCAN